jgi:hypothetical protein
MSDVPILGQQQRHTMSREYVVELYTTSGSAHRLGLNFEVPTDPSGNGLPDLGALKDFNPEQQALANIATLISKAHTDPVIFVDRQRQLAQQAAQRNGVPPERVQLEQQPLLIPDVNGVHIVLRHVESFRYLGPADELATTEVAALKRRDSIDFSAMNVQPQGTRT